MVGAFEITDSRLLSGLRFVHVRTPGPLISVRFVARAGSASENSEERGAAHFLEHFIFKGSVARTYQQINAEAAKYGDKNAYTTIDRTAYYFGSRADNLDHACRLLAEIFFTPRFPADEFEKEREVIYREMATRDADPRTYFIDNLCSATLGENFAHSTIGTKESLGSMTVDTLRSFRTRTYGTNTVGVVVVGNVPLERARAAIERVVPELPQSKFDVAAPGVDRGQRHEMSHKTEQAKIAVVYEGLRASDSTDCKMVDDVYSNIIGGGSHSLLSQRIREDLGLAYLTQAFAWCFEACGRQFYWCDVDAKDLERVECEMLNVHADFPNALTEDRLAMAKENAIYRSLGERETSASVGYVADSLFNLRDGQLRQVIDPESISVAINSLTREDILAYWQSLTEPSVAIMRPE